MQNKYKRNNESIKDVVKCIKSAVEKQRDAIRKKLFNKSLHKKTLQYLFVETIIIFDLSFDLIQNPNFLLILSV